MARTPTQNDHLPIYEDLVRERGDAVAEAQLAAEHTQHQAAELLTDGMRPSKPIAGTTTPELLRVVSRSGAGRCRRRTRRG